MNQPRQAPDPDGGADALGPQIRALFTALDHAGELGGATAGTGRVVRGEAGKEALGTRVRFALELAEDRVGAVRYRAYGCPHTLAACEWLARQLEGRVFTVGAFAVGTFAGGALEALGISTPLEWIERLGLPQAKLGRLLVIEDALRAALAQP